MAPDYARGRVGTGPPSGRDSDEVPQNGSGPRSARGSSGALVRGTTGQLFFLAGTDVGLARLAVRARVTRAEVVALAGVRLAAALLVLAGVRFAGFGSSAASATVALVDS